MAGRERLLDPTGDSERAADTTLAPRPTSLRGLTILHNCDFAVAGIGD
jgi:hypothetical protein